MPADWRRRIGSFCEGSRLWRASSDAGVPDRGPEAETGELGPHVPLNRLSDGHRARPMPFAGCLGHWTMRATAGYGLVPYQDLLMSRRPEPGVDWRSAAPYHAWTPGILSHLRRLAISEMEPRGGRSLKRAKAATPGVSDDFHTNLRSGFKLIAYHEYDQRPAHSARDPRLPEGWMEGAWALYEGSRWRWLGYVNAGATRLTSGAAQHAEFILLAQFPRDSQALTRLPK